MGPLASDIVGQNDKYRKLCSLWPPKKPIQKSDEKESCSTKNRDILIKNVLCLATFLLEKKTITKTLLPLSTKQKTNTRSDENINFFPLKLKDFLLKTCCA